MDEETVTEIVTTYFRIKRKKIIEPLIITEKERMREIGAEQIVDFLLKDEKPKTSDDTFKLFAKIDSLYRRFFEDPNKPKESNKN